ncbi:MAG TPA: DUF364 domain-containing protein [Syntrophorhabdaceae bacterium]|nr:DUF364 domain-containing protein [Syntrophorhabdaceae bacterium]
MIVDETADILQRLYGKALNHIVIEGLVVGIFFTGVKLSSGSGGVSYTPVSDIHKNPCCSNMPLQLGAPGNLRGASVSEILNTSDDSPLLNTVRLVVLNALSSRFFTKNRYIMANNRDVLDVVNLKSVKRIAMVGAISPILSRLKIIDGIGLYVIEKKRQSLHKDEIRYYVPSKKAGEIIPRCDTVIITGASVANGTIDELLGYTSPDARVIVTGPTVSFLPDALFQRHVHIVSGAMVTAVDKMLDILAQGGGAYHLFQASCLRKINIIRDERNDQANS